MRRRSAFLPVTPMSIRFVVASIFEIAAPGLSSCTLTTGAVFSALSSPLKTPITISSCMQNIIRKPFSRTSAGELPRGSVVDLAVLLKKGYSYKASSKTTMCESKDTCRLIEGDSVFHCPIVWHDSRWSAEVCIASRPVRIRIPGFITWRRYDNHYTLHLGIPHFLSLLS